MKMDKVAGSGNDEFYTPKYAIEPILKYIPRGSKVWCPFDTESSLFFKTLKNEGYEVQVSHLGSGVDFFDDCATQQYKDWCDIIISNPPYSMKAEVFQKLFDIDKPFAMLVGVVGLFESQKRFNMFRENEFEIMYLNKRVAYFKDYDDEKPSLNPPFSSVYVCSKLLPQQIVFEEIKKK